MILLRLLMSPAEGGVSVLNRALRFALIWLAGHAAGFLAGLSFAAAEKVFWVLALIACGVLAVDWWLFCTAPGRQGRMRS
jgi:hypothetical protein